MLIWTLWRPYPFYLPVLFSIYLLVKRISTWLYSCGSKVLSWWRRWTCRQNQTIVCFVVVFFFFFSIGGGIGSKWIFWARRHWKISTPFWTNSEFLHTLVRHNLISWCNLRVKFFKAFSVAKAKKSYAPNGRVTDDLRSPDNLETRLGERASTNVQACVCRSGITYSDCNLCIHFSQWWIARKKMNYPRCKWALLTPSACQCIVWAIDSQIVL